MPQKAVRATGIQSDNRPSANLCTTAQTCWETVEAKKSYSLDQFYLILTPEILYNCTCVLEKTKSDSVSSEYLTLGCSVDTTAPSKIWHHILASTSPLSHACRNALHKSPTTRATLLPH